MTPPLYEYSIRIVAHRREIGQDSPEHRHAILTRIKQQLVKSGHTIDMCEMRSVTKVTAAQEPLHDQG